MPKLRFPEFMDAGEWADKKLDEIADLYKGKGISKADIDVQGKVPCIRYGELYTIYSEVIETVFSKTSNPPSDLFFSRKNDVIIPASGETKIDIAKASCVMHDNVALGGDLNVIRSSHNGVFLSYYLNGPKKVDIAKIAQGDTVVHLYPSQLQLLEIGLPIADEQKKIADCLSSIDELITAQTQKLVTLKTHKKGLMQQLFPAEGETLPKLRFPEFLDSGEWETKQLGELLLGHPDYGVNAAAVTYSEDLPAYLRITDISEEGYFLCGKKASVAIKATDEHYMSEGDIVLARTGASVGKSYKFRKEDGKLVFAGFLIRIKPDPTKIDSTFLFNFLFTEQYWNWVRVTSARSGQPGINGNEYAALLIPVPPHVRESGGLSEQQKIADCLSSIDELIAAQTHKLATLKTHKKGLMQQLFPALDEVQR